MEITQQQLEIAAQMHWTQTWQWVLPKIQKHTWYSAHHEAKERAIHTMRLALEAIDIHVEPQKEVAETGLMP